ncbi:unnamed protein product, partial [marine sediment metagenome]
MMELTINGAKEKQIKNLRNKIALQKNSPPRR